MQRSSTLAWIPPNLTVL
uniref:Uncharacterized protein n=1 Tax=Anguilla anguilla TaxID=7936 RepID=A0A0E9QWR5_ANGAN